MTSLISFLHVFQRNVLLILTDGARMKEDLFFLGRSWENSGKIPGKFWGNSRKF